MFLRCVCGKIHTVSTLSPFGVSSCPVCGQDLWDLITGRAYQSDD